MRKKRVTAYWLVPAGSKRELFRQIIRILAKQFDGPQFEPHLTLWVKSSAERAPKQVLKQIQAEPVRLAVRKISCSSKFTKTLFVEFKPDSALQKLVNRLSPGAKSPPDLHLSLLYQNLGIGAKKELAATIKLPFEHVTFDALKAVGCVSPTTTAGDVERWQVVATKRLRRQSTQGT